jgi:hypothetical protein
MGSPWGTYNRGRVQLYVPEGHWGGFQWFSHVVTGASSTEMGNIIALSYLDSPATTSSVTYKTQGRPSTTNNSEEARFQVSSSPSTITLMEIAG